MEAVRTYGEMVNGHLIGIFMKEMVRRAIVEIRRQRLIFEFTEKASRTKAIDYFTTADTAAQAIYQRGVTEDFPSFGIIAEEAGLSIPCKQKDRNIYFTVDPLDGTKAYIRRQSHGIGTMISLVCDGEVIAAFVGDVMTQEIYGYRPDSDKVHRIMEYETHECLEIDPSRPLSDQYILLRDAPGLCSDPVQTLLGTGCFFRGLEVTGGSIGITMARLWKSEVGAVVLRPGDETPWDLCPILGISEKLGFRFMAYNENSRQFENRPPLVTPEKQQRDYEVIVVHESRVAELNGWPEIIR